MLYSETGLDDAKQRLTDRDIESSSTSPFVKPSNKDPDDFDSEQGEEIPRDTGNLVYLTCLLYGIGVLTPFNVIMSCLDFYAITVSFPFLA